MAEHARRPRMADPDHGWDDAEAKRIPVRSGAQTLVCATQSTGEKAQGFALCETLLPNCTPRQQLSATCWAAALERRRSPPVFRPAPVSVSGALRREKARKRHSKVLIRNGNYTYRSCDTLTISERPGAAWSARAAAAPTRRGRSSAATAAPRCRFAAPRAGPRTRPARGSAVTAVPR